jgi:DNA-binding NarL/FixJ family response regulator
VAATKADWPPYQALTLVFNGRDAPMRWNGNEGRPPRLLVADHQRLVGEALVSLLRDNGYIIAARADDGDAASALLAGGGFDAAIIDIDIGIAQPGTPGPLALLAMAERASIPVIITAGNADHPGLADIVESSAAGVMLKTDPGENLGHCLAAVLSGHSWFDRATLALAHDRAAARRGAATLTRRERDVSRLVATGCRNRDIGATLGISEGTVKMHLHNVYSKLGLETRTQLAMDERLRA